MKIIVRQYNEAGFPVSVIHGDGEYESMFNSIKSKLNVPLNCVNPDDHVPEAERNNRTIAERFRAQFHRLPFTAMPKVMIRTLAMRVTTLLNIFPAKGGISTH